jgi:hypothetical protein
MSSVSPGTFMQQLGAYTGQLVRVRVLGAGTSETGEPNGDYIGKIGTVYDDCIAMTVAQQSVLIRIAAIVSVRAEHSLP